MKTKRTLAAAAILFTLGLFLSTTDASAQNVGKAKQGATTKAQTQTPGRHFVDADGDGICDFDVDKDGIPNRSDADYVRPMDGSGRKLGKGKGQGNGMGLRDGSCLGNPSAAGTGVCDGTGSKGKANRGGKK